MNTKVSYTLPFKINLNIEGTDYDADIGSESNESTSVKTLDRTYEPEYDDILPSERAPPPTLIPTTQVTNLNYVLES